MAFDRASSIDIPRVGWCRRDVTVNDEQGHATAEGPHNIGGWLLGGEGEASGIIHYYLWRVDGH